MNNSPQGLAIHTTTGDLAVAIVDAQGSFRIQSWNLGRQLANEIQVKLAEFIAPLSWSDLDFITVAKGPGSYTSTRIGVVIAKTLAQQLQIPVYGISTLMAIARKFCLTDDEPPFKVGDYIAVQMPAHNEDLFGAIYQFQGENKQLIIILDHQRFTVSQWQETIDIHRHKYNNLPVLKAEDNIYLTVNNLLEIALIKQNISSEREQNTWQNLTAFYE